MTECEKYEELISCLLDGEISGEEKDALTRHLAHCPSCRETYRTYSVLFPPQRRETDDVPGALLSGVMDRVAQAPAPAGRRIPRRAIAGWAAAAACVALLCAAVPVLQEKSSPSLSEETTMDTAASEQDSFAGEWEIPESEESAENAKGSSATGSAEPAEAESGEVIGGCTAVRWNEDGTLTAVSDTGTPYFDAGQEFILEIGAGQEEEDASLPAESTFSFTYRSISSRPDGTAVFTGCRILSDPQ